MDEVIRNPAAQLDQLALNVALGILKYGYPAFQFLIPAGLLSAFLVFYISLRKESRLHQVFLALGLSCFVAPILFFAMNVMLKNLVGKTLYVKLELIEWAGFWCGGIVLAVLYLRVAPQSANVLMNKLTRTNKLERNKRTDVRQIGEFLPEAAHKFDPLDFIQRKRDQAGIFLGLDEKGNPVNISFSSGTSAPHVQVCGTTGAGKGVSLGLMASQFLERGEALFFCDPKNDEWAPSVLYAAAQRTGKPYYFINLNRPNQAQLNPFAGCTEEEAFELLQAGFSLIEKGDASDFYGIADRREAGVVAKLIAQKGLNAAQAYAARLDVAGDPECAPKFYGRLRELGETPSINATNSGVDLAEVIAQGGCVYIVGSMRNDIIKTVQRILLVRLIQLAERRDRMASPLRPVCIVLDEVKYHLSRPALEALGAARDKGVHLVLAHQSLGDLRDCTKDLNPDAVVDAVVENTKMKIFYRVMSPDTAEWAAAMSGEILVDDESRKVIRNIAAAELVSPERNIRQDVRYFIDTNMLLNLPPSVAVVYGDGLPRFVSIQPLRVKKSPEAVRIHAVAGAVAPTPEDAIRLDLPSDQPVQSPNTKPDSILAGFDDLP